MPSEAGVYQFKDEKGKIIYVGKAKDLKSRVSSYFSSSSFLGDKTRVLVSKIASIQITIVESELEALLLEAFLIKKFRPKYNVRMVDSKSYLLVQITMEDVYPKVLLARHESNSKSKYFGPYPNSSALRLVLKTVRRIFPYQSVLNHPKRVCLYNHLGLCPCPPVNDSPELRREYRANIRGVIRILEGQSKAIMNELEKQRDTLSENEEYEEAGKTQRKINALSIITHPFHKPFEYDTNPNLREDLRQEEIDDLRTILADRGLHTESLHRIECYDISNIQGTNATASLVVITDGEKDSSQYRRFKIRKDGKPNDFAMMEEVLTRRLKRTDWEKPDLIVVDGGKGQITSALKAMQATGVHYPLIGLAKREETIIVPQVARVSQVPQVPRALMGLNEKSIRARDTRGTPGTGGTIFLEVSLPKSTKALHLIMRLRDEAHRFALTYHRKIRSRAALE